MKPNRTVERIGRQLGNYLIYFVEGDHGWGTIRMVSAAFAIMGFVFIARVFQEPPPMPFLESLELTGLSRTGVEFLASFLMPQTLRHIVAPLFGFVLALLVGASYLRNLLELPSFSQAWNFLTTTVFGLAYPGAVVNEGKATVDDPDRNPLLRFGGPGWVEVKLGSAALFERGAGPSAVRGVGTYFLRRWEIIRETFDLREIERAKASIKVHTKDGIPLVLDEVRARFRLRTRGQRTEAEPFPVLVNAVRRATYNRKVSDRGLENWADMVTGSVVGTITNWISRRRMDDLIPPPNQPEEIGGGDDAQPPANYRQSLHLLFQEGGTRRRFEEMGAELLWVSVGHLRADPDVDPEAGSADEAQGRDRIHGQMIDTWRSASQANIAEDEADTAGYSEWLSETARVQAQVEMIKTLTRGLRQAHEEGVLIGDLIAARGVEYLGLLNDAEGGTGRPLLTPEQILRMVDEGKTGKTNAG